ncbi:TspO/MBR family protein [Hansschlegelia sp.]|uniref:TspO/MBR family protein n=1 Tax=Hansschlegelia sp. TaxID=2041892 RepID=UPI002BEF1018|nr:TspO/MBR family protein [Hansschlegelia sp.]HVI29846.1 TspO/MBR family protein [Hansschlegelia sp.]
MTPAAARGSAWLSPRSLLILAAALAVCFAAAGLGSVATTPNIAPWYEGLRKPPFNPPNVAFPIAWTLLFALMALALWRVCVRGSGGALRAALMAFGVQLALNIGWSFAFFTARSPLLGLVDILLLLPAIVWTIARFRRIDGPAAALLYPYLAWVSFAAVLNGSILYLNG